MKATLPEKIECRACGQLRQFDEFREFSHDPLMLMDFCTFCEQKEGTITLYRRYNAYGTPDVIKAVYAAHRIPLERRKPDQVRLLISPKAVKVADSPESAAQVELQRRELCRRRFMYFVTTFDPQYNPGWVHQDIARRLENFVKRVERLESPRLMLFMPPRMGKSREVSDMFPSWLLGHHPEWEVIEASYGIDLPIGFSRNIRDRLRDPEYQAIFEDTRIRADSQAMERWITTRGGSYTAAGVGVGITGKGYNVGICDDLIKDYEASQSETIRDNTWNWYQSVFRFRAAPGAGIILIMTRWHDGDVAGKLLEAEAQMRKAGVPEEEIENWEVVSYPALAVHDEYLMPDGSIHRGELLEDDPKPLRLLRKKDEPLHPERYPRNEVMKLKHATAKPIWNAMHQQNPTPDDGDFFRKTEMRYRQLSPDWIPLARIFITTDYAISKLTKRNFTVTGVFALTHDDHLYLLDARRGRWGTLEIVKNIVELVEKWNPELYAGERGAIHAAVWPLVEAELKKKRIMLSVDEKLVPMQDKELRARPLQGRMQAGNFFFSYSSGTLPDVIDAVEHEMLRFPTGVDDDCVDMCAWGARLALTVSLPEVPTTLVRQESWQDKLTATAVNSEESHMAA